MLKDWIRNAQNLIASQGAVLVATKGDDVRLFKKSGIAPLMELLAEAPDFLRGSFVVDKVVGRAAAMLMIHGGVAALHANLISEPAVSTLTAHNLPFTCDARTPYIQNRDKTGYCPMEQTCLDIDDPAEAYLALQAKLQAMKKGK